MNQEVQNVNTIAPIQNVSRCMDTLERAMNRPAHLPGIIAFYGPSGWGKTTAAAYIGNVFRAYRVEVKDSWTRKGLLESILVEMRIKPAKTIYEMARQVAEQLAISGTPLIIDEFDYIVKKNNVDLIRDLYDTSGAPILIMGEENLETNLRKWERFHNRVIDWVPAVPADMADTKHLAKLYCDKITITDDLINNLLDTMNGNVSRICINLNNIQEYALQQGKLEFCLNDWTQSGMQFYTGCAPRRRVM